MSPEELQDAVLSILSAANAPLTADDICRKMQPTPAVRDVRIALRELSDQGEVLKDASQRWSAVAKAAEVRAARSRFHGCRANRCSATVRHDDDVPNLRKTGRNRQILQLATNAS